MARRRWSFSRTMFVLLSLTLALGACARPIAPQLAPGADASGSASPGRAPLRAPTSHILEAYGRLPLHFEENRGQADASVRFVARTEGGPIALTRDGLALGLDGGTVALTFAGAATPRLEALGPLAGRVNYYLGSDRAKWRTDIPTYERVRYERVYPGVDVVVYGNRQRLEYDFVLAPGADPRAIRVRVEGADALELSGGDLIIRRGRQTIVQQAPVIYQERAGRREPVKGRYVLHGREVAFLVGAYDRNAPLVIDPVIVYAAKVGPARARVITVDAAGSAIIAGEASQGYPQVNAAFGPKHCCLPDMVVTKLTPNGNALVYSTYIGTFIGDDFPTGIVADSVGNAWLAGYVSGRGLGPPCDWPTTPDAVMPSWCWDTSSAAGVVAKFSPTGSLVYSTYLAGTNVGSPGPDQDGGCVYTGLNGIALDAADNAYVVGRTTTTDYPTTPGAYQPARAPSPNGDYCRGFPAAAVVTKLTAAGALAYSTYLDSAREETATAVAVDASGNAYVGGAGGSAAPPPFPVTATLTASGSQAGGYVLKLDASGFPIQATVIGATPWSMDVGADGSAYVAGPKSDHPCCSPPVTDFTTVNAMQPTPQGGGDGFAARINAAGTSYMWSTYVGGSGADSVDGLTLDVDGNAWLVGTSNSPNFPTKAPLMPKTSANEAVVVQLSATGTLLFGSPVATGLGAGIAVDLETNVYLTGNGTSPSIPTPGAYHNGSGSLFVMKLGAASGGGGPEAVVWTSVVRATVNGTTLTKTTGCEGCADAGAISQQTIASGEGFVQFSVSPQEYLTVGLSNGNPGTSGSEIDFGLRFHAGSPAAVQVRESGIYKAEFLHIAGAAYKIAVEGGVVKYYQNGTLKYTSALAPTYPLLVDTSLLTLGAAVQNAMISTGGGGGGGGDTIAPTVAITSPEDGATVSGTVTVTATASDDVGVSSVIFKMNGEPIGQDTTAPYAIEWFTDFRPPGTYTLTAEARDAAGNTAVATVTVTVTDSQPPHASIATPAHNSTVSGTVNITAYTSDNVGTVALQYKLDGENLGPELTTGPPWALSWNTNTTPNGTHSLTAVVRDAAGNVGDTSLSPNVVTVSNAGPPPGPSPQPVTWTSAVNVAVSGNTITKNAGCNGCADAGAISQQTIASGGGSVSFTIGAGSQMTVGLGTGNAGTGGTDVEFGLRFYPGSPGYVEVRESGVYKWDFAHVAGATYKVAVEAGVVKYYQNGVLKYTSAAAPSFPLVVDTSLVAAGSAVQNAVIGP